LTEIVAVVLVVDHKYDAKPVVAAKFAVCPDKIFASFPAQLASVSVMETVGIGNTSTNFEAVMVQPSAFVAVTVNVVFAVGETEMVAVDAEFDQEYAAKPAVAAKFAEFPVKIFESSAVQLASVSTIARIGEAKTVIVCEAETVQPSVVVAVTE
jgi:S-methylmethionine-dependent homocysteine/selenocysteine methylase